MFAGWSVTGCLPGWFDFGLWFWCFVVDFGWWLSGGLVFGVVCLGCSGLLMWV